MKSKLILSLVLGICMSVSTATAFASSSFDAQTVNSGGMNVDNLRNNQVRSALSRDSVDLSKSASETGGGVFTVAFYTLNGTERFKANYKHDTKIHAASVSNRYGTISSGWKDPKITATASMNAAYNGNIANWKTK